MTDREQNAREARFLRAQGLKLREIGERLGVAISTVSAWLGDPDGSKLKARKDSYRGTCQECGKKTDGSAGPGKAPTRCVPCAARHGTFWTADRIVQAIQAWERLYGDPPGAADWAPAMTAGRPCHADVLLRFKQGRWPTLHTVQRVFGSWNAGIEAAGFEPRGVGQRGKARAAA